MKSLNTNARAVFHSLIKGLEQPGDAKKIDNTDGAFMPVHVDFVWQNEHGRIFSVAHNYIQNGDVMADPDMTFLVTDQGIYPMTFQQDNLAFYQEAIGVEEEQVIVYDSKTQADLASFANDWMGNIKKQQNLELPNSNSQIQGNLDPFPL